ncbi:MAG: sugar phosphate isomerase/epimerase [Limnochordaceae bacterium]|nr:sugar phosphate isomerase/epimerase [Limnochordaceae bacterium]
MIWMHSYTFRGYPWRRAVEKAAEFGYTGLELSTVHLPADNPLAAVPAAVDLARRYGVPVGALSFGAQLAQADPAARQQSLENAIRFIRTAGQLGIPLVNGGVAGLVGPRWDAYGDNGSRLATDQTYAWVEEGLKALDEAAAEAHVKVTLEIHMNSVHDTAATTLRLIQESGVQHVVANLDAGNMYATPHAEEATAAVALLGKHLGYVHLKNCRRIPGTNTYDYSWTLAEGDLDHYRIFKALAEIGYAGPMTIEYCGAGDPARAAAEDIAYVRKVLADVRRDLQG